jgi:hypothetical protein
VAETEAMCVCVNVLYGVKEKLNEEGLNEMWNEENEESINISLFSYSNQWKYIIELLSVSVWK